MSSQVDSVSGAEVIIPQDFIKKVQLEYAKRSSGDKAKKRHHDTPKHLCDLAIAIALRDFALEHALLEFQDGEKEVFFNFILQNLSRASFFTSSILSQLNDEAVDVVSSDLIGGFFRLTLETAIAQLELVRGKNREIHDLRSKLHVRERQIGALTGQNADLVRRVYEDPLTGLMNDAALKEYLDGIEVGTQVILVFADLTGFKLINDIFGHHVGDEAIAQAGKNFASCRRQSDHQVRVVRQHGDEFVMVLPLNGGVNAQELMGTVGQRVLDAFSKNPIVLPWETLAPRAKKYVLKASANSVENGGFMSLIGKMHDRLIQVLGAIGLDGRTGLPLDIRVIPGPDGQPESVEINLKTGAGMVLVQKTEGMDWKAALQDADEVNNGVKAAARKPIKGQRARLRSVYGMQGGEPVFADDSKALPLS